MGNALNDIGENYDFKFIQKVQHPLFGQIDILECQIQDFPDIEQYMRVIPKLINQDYIAFIKRYIKLQNLHKHEMTSPFLIYISNNIFECPSHSLFDEIQVKRQQGTQFAESELWYLAKSLIAGYSIYLQIPELVKQTQLTLHNIFITKKGHIKLSLHTLFLINATNFKNQYIEESQYSHKISKEIGLVLLEASCLSFEDSIKVMDMQYSIEYSNFVKDMIGDTKSLQYFQNYQMSKKISKTIYGESQLKKTATLLAQQTKSLKQSQIIETYHVKSPVKTDTNQFDQVSKIASIPEVNEQDQKKSQQLEFFSGRKSTQPIPNVQSEIYYHSKQQSLQINDQSPQMIQQQQFFDHQNVQYNHNQPVMQQLDVLSEKFNQRFWKAIDQAKRQVLIYEQRSKQIY
ncbi:unnamed protein product (macronuclear) [Paramecium tetraurelia]|uniref:Uncharacterized protein n=1 Tax=Paramecium tetraurelia TaxID=5888 RepID=A0DWN5_PARTE|nr:uncharacterized protein GSPATT00021095001 [Paramecium tetraurelia]CAK87452.1 unnamed protein product [Paramecium tetraurelia]|eukprot:XP_001454849.1 hypothetical protein (macronuclear) [Paramecium tetraurelia strain d4-2]